MSKLQFATKQIHTGFLTEDPHGSMHMPIYEDASFSFASAEDIEDAFRGRVAKHAYSRISNPTVSQYEQKVKTLTDSHSVTAMASGMGAISNVMLSVLQSGDTILTSKHLFANTLSLFTNTLKPFGIKTVYADLLDKQDLLSKLDESVRMIFFETISNPQLEVADITMLSDIAKKNDILLVCDTTLTPPNIFDAKQYGINIEVISSTKWFSGGATSVGGLIIDYANYDWANNPRLQSMVPQFGNTTFTVKLKREVARNIGACMSPQAATLQSNGIETLSLRAEKAMKNAQELAEFLTEQSIVEKVNFIGLESHPNYLIAKKQFSGNTSALLTFSLKDRSACFRLLNSLNLIKRATNLYDNRSLAIHPASTMFWDLSHEEKTTINVPENMIRLSVGIEDINDLKNDIKQSLDGNNN